MKKQANSKDLITEMQLMLNKRNPKLTLENMIFSDLSEEDMDDYYGDEEVPENTPHMEEKPVSGDVDITETINNIRQMALKAIAKLADDPTSEQYQLLKKIWNLVDKTFEADKKNGTETNYN